MLTLGALTFDAADPARLGAFWAAVLRRPVRPGRALPQAAVIDADSSGPTWLFLPVPEPKTAKNRFHPDLHTADLEEEVARVTALGARVLARHDSPGRWVVLAEPEGNEFCLVEELR